MAGGRERVAQLHSRNQHKSLFVCFPTWKQSRPCRLGTIPAHNTAQSRAQNRTQNRAQGSEQGSEQGSKQGSEQVSEQGSEKGTEQGSEQDSQWYKSLICQKMHCMLFQSCQASHEISLYLSKPLVFMEGPSV